MTAAVVPGRPLRMAPGKDRPGCLILPGAGGGLMPYLRLASVLGSSHAVDFVRPLGLMPGEEPETTVAEMAESVLGIVNGAATEPQLVVGWSLGGLVAWEVCARLAEDGHRPDLVIVDSSPLPRVPEPGEDEWIRDKMVADLGPKADPQTVGRMVRTFAAQAAALTDYATESGYPGRVLLLVCSPYDKGDREAAVRRWRELAPNLDLVHLDAGHYDVFEPAHLPQLAEAIQAFQNQGGL
ncbi:alpha/beta fold hydrolase [Streptomyces scopuliridis]|uniref:Alpha/beta fold hydrolase n=1 Tax=Streptomyces scopuliridis TaxID=452529 RepID=A0ACD4ZD12_9ACTN|nr:alpha/beta fold hydrolase [Streptomyces scopuliridis]WSB95647.1 alpha/beta fold hydrolase [Streptomyces scopuliridis]WSC10644.1 alpha/beta fold hydrolase [Streptomyces scopuliridis]